MAEKKKKTSKKGEIVKKKSKPRGFQAVPTGIEPGDNARFLQHQLQINNLPGIDVTKPEEVAERAKLYYEICSYNDMKPSMAGLALAYGVNRSTLWKWIHGVESNYIPDECRQIMAKASAILNSLMEDYMQNGKIHPTAGIFLLKNNFGYVDETKQVVEHKNPLGAEGNAEELRRKYQDNIIDVEVEEPKTTKD